MACPRFVLVKTPPSINALLFVTALAVQWALPLAPCQAAEAVDRIAAVVNDEAITIQELDERVRMTFAMAHMPDSIDMRKRVMPQVLRKIIEERLTMAEAKKYKLTITPKEIDDGIRQVERQNGMPEGSMVRSLNAVGVSTATLRGQMTADMTWLRLTAGMFQNTVKVGEDEITDRLETLAARNGKAEYLVAEIFLSIDKPDQEEQVRGLGERLIEQLRTGAPFAALATQFSQSTTAASGGTLGWMTEGDLDPELFNIIKDMTPGTISKLVRTPEGIHILALAQRRISGVGQTGAESTVLFSTMNLPVGADAPSPQILAEKALKMVEGAHNCQDFQQRATRNPDITVQETGPATLESLPADMRKLVADIPEGKLSTPVGNKDSLHIVMMCSRTDKPAPLPTRDMIRNQIETERVDMAARRLMRDLRRSAFIDTRL